MTPTLNGRWQTRLFLLAVLGAPLTAVFGWLYADFQTFFVLLGYLLLFGCAWDMLYSYLQTWRWNRDWPPVFAFLAGLWEGGFLLALVQWMRLPGVSAGLTAGQFLAHYGTVFFVTYLASMSLMPILFPRWRFNGWQWLGR